MNRRFVVIIVLGFAAPAALAQTDTFESYAVPSQLDGQGGWAAWDLAAASGALSSNTYAHSGTNSVDIRGSTSGSTSDLVHMYSALSGQWKVITWVYIPSSNSGTSSYFILMDKYVANGTKHWATQLRLDLYNNQVYDDLTWGSGSVTLVRDQWIPIEVTIDLDNNTQVVKYNNQTVISTSWVRYSGGVQQFVAIDLYGDKANHTYFDDVSVVDLNAKPHVSRWREVDMDGTP